jgi:biopolymer transport protein ExbD
MLVVHVAPWQTYGPEWNVFNLWDRLDWILRSDILVLAALLAYVAFVVVRDSYYFREASHAPGDRVRALIVDLNRSVRILRSIATTAPYLGLLGACFGIVESFRGVGMQKGAAMAMIVTNLAHSLLTTMGGLLVALAAAIAFNYLLWLRAKLELNADRDPPSQTRNPGAGSRIVSKYPLKKPFSKLPPFALIAAPGLAVVIVAYMSFSTFRHPEGLPVLLLKSGHNRIRGALVQSPLITVLDAGAGQEPEIYLNSQETTWNSLGSSVCTNPATQAQSTAYVESDENVRWADVVTAIDSVRAHCDYVVLLTTAPEVSSSHARRSGSPKK